MENKKYLPLKIAHFLVMAVGIAFYFVSLIVFNPGASTPLSFVSSSLNILALAAGVVYLAFGYKKKANLYYKLFMWLFLASELIERTCIFNDGVNSMLNVFLNLVIFLAVVLLVGAKDYGVVKSNIISITLVALNVYMLIRVLIGFPNYAEASFYQKAMLFDVVGQLILASTAALMVCGKYLDKSARKAK